MLKIIQFQEILGIEIFNSTYTDEEFNNFKNLLKSEAKLEFFNYIRHLDEKHYDFVFEDTQYTLICNNWTGVLICNFSKKHSTSENIKSIHNLHKYLLLFPKLADYYKFFPKKS